MTDLLVKNPGLLSTIQDAGRFGSRRYGVPWSGVLDPAAAQIANALVENSGDMAVVEFFQQGPVFKLEEGRLRVAVAGDCLLTLKRGAQKSCFRAWRSLIMQAGDILEIGRIHAGKVGYLAVEGGFDLQPVLGSCSTYLRAEFGGVNGKPLQTGDLLPIKSNNVQGERLNLYLPTPQTDAEESLSPQNMRQRPIRVILGPQDDYFTPTAIQKFLHEVFKVGHDSDRMGCRLSGPTLEHIPEKGVEILSDGLVPGAIQIPGNGSPIVLLADGPTVGGYPKIATVISADLPKLATLEPGAELRFEAISNETAEAILRKEAAAHIKRLNSIVPLPKISEPFAETML